MSEQSEQELTELAELLYNFSPDIKTIKANIQSFLLAGHWVQLVKDQKESLDFAHRIAKVMDKLRDSHVFFYLQQAYPESADEWEWTDFQKLLDRILLAGGK